MEERKETSGFAWVRDFVYHVRERVVLEGGEGGRIVSRMD